MPVMGKPYSKDNTKQLFGDLLINDPTFATEKFKREVRHIEKSQNEHAENSKMSKSHNASHAASHARFSVID